MTIQFPSIEEKLAYWNLHKPDGSPDAPVDELIDYVESKLPGENWDAFTIRQRSVRGNYERAADVTLAIYGDDKFDVPDDARSGIDELLAKAAIHYTTGSSVGADTWMRWIKLAPIFHFLPTGTDERTADFAWARVRCFLASAGFTLWPGLVGELQDAYEGCPFDAQEDEATWKEGLLKAHATCGWPTQIAYLSWSRLSKALGALQDQAPRWLRMLSLLHILKHARMSDSQGIVVHYAGVSSLLEPERGNAIASWGRAKTALLQSLGGIFPSGRQKTPTCSLALDAAVAHMEINHLLRKEPLGAMPANLLAGPWTMPVPDHTAHDGFFQTGLRLSGLWAANKGLVGKESLGQTEVLKYDWNCKNPATFSEQRELFVHGLPKTYQDAWPSEVFRTAFPNLDTSWAGGAVNILAAEALLDAPVAASLVRHLRPEFRSEYPAVVFMPSNPSPTDSTNQGKSQAALVYARACNPAITKLVSINDSSSAPDIRTVASEIRSTGSIAIDEFRPPKNQTHIFSHDNMQALCTGSCVASGRVYENDGTVALRSSPVFSAKVYEVPPDIHNRSLAHWLGPLTDAMRGRTEVLEEIRTGALSIKMRLGMHAILENTDLFKSYKEAGRKSSSRGLRFDAHRTLAACILKHRAEISMEEAYTALDTVTELMQNKLRNHVSAAVDTGLVAAMEFGTALKLRLSYLFDDLNLDEFKRLRQTAGVSAASRCGDANCIVPKELLVAWGQDHGLEHAPLQNYLTVLTGAKRHVSNRSVIMALTSSLHEVAPQEGSTWLVPGEAGLLEGWMLKRGKGDTFGFICTHPRLGK